MKGFAFSHRSEINLEGVHKHLITLARRSLELSQIDFAITEGVRTLEKQKIFMSTGKSKTFNSRHLTGHAIDIMAYENGHASWDFKYYSEIANVFHFAANELNIPIEWGGEWMNFKDGPHFQLPWKDYPLNKTHNLNSKEI